MMNVQRPAPVVSPIIPVTLLRELGKWDLTAIGINQVIGSAVFILPSQIASQVGSWSPFAFVVVGATSLLIALCFAEVSSRFEGTGGPYLYAHAAFGPFVAFEVGWMQWVTRVTSQAAVVNAIALALGFYWPVATTGIGRGSLISAITLTLAWVNIRGVRQSAFLINLFTISKLLPLGVFVLAGMWYLDPGRLTTFGTVTLTEASTAALLLVTAFGGYEVISIPAGEARDPRRHLPFAFVTTIIAVTIVMTLVQVVALGTTPDLSLSTTPLADAALLFMGGAGAFLISAGAVISMIGGNVGQVLTGSRMLFALGANGQLPRFFGAIHQRYRTPANAIAFTTTAALGLALSGSFIVLSVASAIARLVVYIGVCAATLRLRQARFIGAVKPAAFVIPLHATIPLLAIAASMLMLVGATVPQLIGGVASLLAGAVLFIANNRQRLAIERVIAGP